MGKFRTEDAEVTEYPNWGKFRTEDCRERGGLKRKTLKVSHGGRGDHGVSDLGSFAQRIEEGEERRQAEGEKKQKGESLVSFPLQ